MYVTEMSPALNNSAALMQATEGCDHICARVAIQKTCRCVNTVAERKIMLYTTCKWSAVCNHCRFAVTSCSERHRHVWGCLLHAFVKAVVPLCVNDIGPHQSLQRTYRTCKPNACEGICNVELRKDKPAVEYLFELYIPPLPVPADPIRGFLLARCIPISSI